MSETVYIYILRDPTDRSVRYVGLTTNPHRREIDHRCPSTVIRGYRPSEETKRKAKESNIKTWANPELRTKHAEFGRQGAIKQWAAMTPEKLQLWIEKHQKVK